MLPLCMQAVTQSIDRPPTARQCSALAISQASGSPRTSGAEFAGAFLFEDVGVTAFHGAIPAIKDKQNLQLLAGIAPVEAYHAAILRTLLYQKGLELVTPYNIRVFDFVQVRAQSTSCFTVAPCMSSFCPVSTQAKSRYP